MPGPDYHGPTHCPEGTDPIPCLTTPVLDWVFWSCGVQNVPAGDGTVNGDGYKFADALTIFGESASSGYSIVTESLTGEVAGTRDCAVLKLPAGPYLVQAEAVFSDNIANVNNNWDFKIAAKTVATQWSGEDLWSTTSTRSVASTDPNPAVIWENLLGAQYKVVEDLGDGYGLMTLRFLNADTVATHDMEALVFAMALTLGVTTDSFHT